MPIRIFLFVLILATSLAKAEVVITPKDIERFGWEHVGKEATMVAVLHDVYVAKRKANRGRVAAVLDWRGEIYPGVAMFQKGTRSDEISPFFYSCVELTGTVETAPVNHQGTVSEVPTFNIKGVEIREFEDCY